MEGTGTAGRILLADDDAMVARALTRSLSKAGYEITTASDGRIAAEILKGSTFDVVLSDISMPGMTGLDLLRQVRNYDLDIPVLLMTGAPEVKSAVEALEHGALRYLTKPLDTEVLLKEIAYAVRVGRITRLKREALAHVGDLGKFVGDRAGLEARFQNALSLINMVYQPIVSHGRREVFSHEALVRSGEPSLAHPGALFDAAERIDGLHALGRAIRGAVAPIVANGKGIVFVNLHTHDLVDEQLYSSSAPLSRVADRVVLEITERASLDEIKDVNSRIEALRRLGFKLALDDLGAGYAGLNSFAQLRPDFVKLDLSLVRNIDSDSTKQRVVGTMTALCHELGMQVVAEGVETKGERDQVVKLGCDLLQGYLFAKPGPPFPSVKW